MQLQGTLLPENFFRRYVLAIGFGSGVTLALVYVMTVLIRTEGEPPPDAPPGHVLTFVPELKELPVTLKNNKPKEPPPVEKEPPTKLPPLTGETLNPVGSKWSDPGPVRQKIDIGGGRVDGDFLPVMTSAPEYPDRARVQGIEGYVLVEFTVDEIGRVRDARVLEAVPSSIFNRAALRAIERYKYKPRVLNGNPVPVHGVKQRITFELS